jgi:hypothetical protein
LSGDSGSFQLLTALPINNIAPGASAQLQWQFAPLTNGTKTATFQITTTDPDYPTITVQLQGKGFGDDDRDGVPASSDAFPYNPFDWLDTDGDGMGDNFENLIINAAQTDGDSGNDWLQTFDDVLPLDDFDGDGFENIQEFRYGTDPTQTTSLPLGGAAVLAALMSMLGAAVFHRKMRASHRKDC